jgi:hypothetical protein
LVICGLVVHYINKEIGEKTMASIYRPVIAASSVMFALSLAACGGGGSGASSTGTPAAVQGGITPSNYQSAAANAVNAVGPLVDIQDVGSMVVGVQADGGAQGLADTTVGLYKHALALNPKLVTGVQMTQPCDLGGTMSIDTTNTGSSIRAGDTAKISANNCRFADIPMVNGAMSLTITSVTGDPVSSNNYSLGMAVKFDNFNVTEGAVRTGLSGDLNIAYSQAGTSTVNAGITGQSLTVSQTGGGAAGTYQLSQYDIKVVTANGNASLSGKYTMSGNSSSVGGSFSYTAQTLQPLVVAFGSSYPSSGALIVRGTPATVTLTALNSNNVRVDYSEKGDGVVTATNTLTWTALSALR